MSWTMFRHILSVLMSHVVIKIPDLSGNSTYFLKVQNYVPTLLLFFSYSVNEKIFLKFIEKY